MINYMTALNDSDLRKAFGLRLKQLRKDRKLTQKELAATLNIQTTHLNKYEAGINAPPLPKLAILARVLSVSLDYLVLGKEDEETTLTNQGLLERIKHIENFNRDDQETIARVIDAMIAKQHMQSVPSPAPL